MIKEYTKGERLMHEFILQYLIVCADPEDTSLVIDIIQPEWETA